MPSKYSMFNGLAVTVVIAGTALALNSMTSDRAVGGDASLRLPDNYRERFESLGSWAVAADSPDSGSQQLHQVFASPGTTNAYRTTGGFPDGTILVKEVYATDTQTMTTGLVSRAAQLKGWFVMVRDSGNTHPGDPLWGDGWGWSWFDADKPTQTTSTDYTSDCQSCHEPARATDFVYVQGYPPLRR